MMSHLPGHETVMQNLPYFPLTSFPQQHPAVQRLESELEVRPPHEAQSKIGDVTDRHCALPHDNWKHPNTALINESVKYNAKVGINWNETLLSG